MTTISSNNVLSLIVFIFFSKELFFFDEELLVVFSFFVIFNLLFFSIKGLVAFELTQRIALIYKQFIVYLDSKKNLLTLILLFYNNRTLILISKFLNTIDDFYFICQDNFQLYVNFKEEYQKGKFKIIDTYSTDWMKEVVLDLSIKGLDIDQVYEKLVFQIAGSRIEKQEGIDLKQSVQQAQEIEKIKKKIAELENKKLNDKQFNIQLKISNEIRILKKHLQN